MKGTPQMSIYPVALQIDRWTITPAVRIDDLKTHESTIKTAAPRGALRVFYNYVSVDAMSCIQYDDRGLVSRCSHGIRCILRIAPCRELHPRRADGTGG